MSYGSTYATRARQTHTPPAMRPASAKQAEWVGKLRTEKVLDATAAALLAEWDNGSHTGWVASRLLGNLFAAARKPVAGADPVTEAGMYRTPAGEVYRVQAGRTGERRLYAKLLVIEQVTTWEDNGTVDGAEVPLLDADGAPTYRASFDYAAGAMRKLSAAMRMTQEQARQIGHDFGICCNCAAVLTDPVSIAAGIGPVCASRV